MLRAIHYGSSAFIPEKFNPIKNQLNFPIKPVGGLWGSLLEDSQDWPEFCRDWKDTSHLDESFTFSISPFAKIATIEELASINAMNEEYGAPPLRYRGYQHSEIWLDFEKLCQNGLDAINFRYNQDTRWLLYGWDVNSVLILNNEVIIPD